MRPVQVSTPRVADCVPLYGGSLIRILVTGGAGYIGAVLVPRLLEAGHTVTVLDNLMYGNGEALLPVAGHSRFSFVHGDARGMAVMSAELKRADAIIPLAAIVGAPACDADQGVAAAVNYKAIKSLMKFRSESQLVIYPTTNSGYGDTGGECTEETPLKPLSLYAQSKTMAEEVVLAGGNAISLRLATVFGVSPRMRTDLLVNHFTLCAIRDGYLTLFESHFKRNFVHVQDVADCFLHCLNHPSRMRGLAYNVGNDDANVSKAALAGLILRHVPNFYIHDAPIGQDPDKRDYVVSNARLREAGFEAKRSLDSGIRELITAYKLRPREWGKNV